MTQNCDSQGIAVLNIKSEFKFLVMQYIGSEQKLFQRDLVGVVYV